jgi:lipoprotein-anchoring transpeptidase ErfK/SrfK
MQRFFLPILAVLIVSTPASAQYVSYAAPQRTTSATPPMVVAAPARQLMRGNLGGGFTGDHGPQPQVAAPSSNFYSAPTAYSAPAVYSVPAAYSVPDERPQYFHMDPRFVRQEVVYDGKQAPGTIVIDTPNHFLYLVEKNGKALRYGIGVGRPGFTWSGVHAISAKKVWPDWVPPKEMLARQPYLPQLMAGGPDNPLGARALYIGSTLYRIHGSNEPWTIGHNVSSGCIRMRNADVIDLYDRVKVGAKVVVL